MKPLENMLRIVDPGFVTDPSVLANYRGLLTADERARVDRFVYPDDRHVRLVARASLRLLLAEFTGIPAPDFRFRYNDYGKPFLQDPLEQARVHFNVSHTKDLIAIYISAKHEVGVDVESIRPMSDLYAVAERFFSPPEVADLRTLEGEAAAERFFQYWTLKESYIKARGMGLSLPLDQFWFDLCGDKPSIRFLPGIVDDPKRWCFSLERLASGHHVATASCSAEEAF